jgi:imidazolonepropionase-like amidohydrolase
MNYWPNSLQTIIQNAADTAEYQSAGAIAFYNFCCYDVVQTDEWIILNSIHLQSVIPQKHQPNSDGMNKPKKILPALIILFLLIFTSCENDAADHEDLLIFTNATIWDGISQTMQPNAALATRDGRVVEILDMNDPDFPENAQIVDLENSFIVPGLINAHGHVGMARGLETGPDVHSEENVREQLAVYARYGITTVVSLGDEPQEAFAVRDQAGFSSNGLARLFLSGPVLNPSTPEEAFDDVNDLMQYNPDWTKIRVDDGLGQREKMQPEVYSAVIEASHGHGTPLAAHIVALEDAKGVLEQNGDLIAHSVRDEAVDRELIDLMLEQDVCITPTLTREISVFVYAERPDFFDDPFFLAEADPEVIEQLEDPGVQERYTGTAADYFREALPLAKENMMALHNAGIRVAMGTDSGPPARFQGYFEHMEMEMMEEAGMSPPEILRSATLYAAECMQIDEQVGTLEPDKWADFVVTEENPFDEIRNLRTIHSVYIGANRVER